ncbi:MAG: hypothetical protein JXA96_07300 [Sedimentisphaerales bacterium]|nr:hypothetical protein [Sedimentisphaerales bacterium]
MARKRGKMALYEVMSKARARAEQNRTVEPLQPQRKPEPVKPVPVVEEIDVPEPQVAVNWRKKPRIVQYNLGRIEFSMPYQLAITAGLGLILLLLLAYRFGQFSSGNVRQSVTEPAGNSGGNSNSRPGVTGLASPASMTTPAADNTENRVPENTENVAGFGDPDGDNVIVIAEHGNLSQLRPVEKYFNDNEIPTQIYQVGDRYQLWTVAKFKGDPKTSGTTGNIVLQKIIDIGANYEAPQGYESFAAHKFSDAYGRKVVN